MRRCRRIEWDRDIPVYDGDGRVARENSFGAEKWGIEIDMKNRMARIWSLRAKSQRAQVTTVDLTGGAWITEDDEVDLVQRNAAASG